METLLKKFVLALAALKRKLNAEIGKIKKLNRQIKSQELEIKVLNKTISSLKSIKHEYPKEVKINNLPKHRKSVHIRNWKDMPKQKQKDSVKIKNWGDMPKLKQPEEMPKWLPGVLNSLVSALTTLQITVAQKTMRFIGELWEIGIKVRFDGAQPIFFVDKKGNRIDIREFLGALGQGIGPATPGKGFKKIKIEDDDGNVIDPAGRVILDEASVGDEQGYIAMGIRKDTAASLVDADGDYTTFIFDADGNLHTFINNPTIEKTSGEPAGSKHLMIGGKYQAGAPLILDDDDAGAFLIDNIGRQRIIVDDTPKTAFGENLVGELFPQFQGSFEYTVDNTDLNTNTVVGSGAINQGSGMAQLLTGATTGSSALLQSKQHAKYRPGLGGLIRFTSIFDSSPAADTEQYLGIMDEVGSSAAFKNGYAIGYDGVTFGFQRWQDDAKISIPQASWDDPLDGSGESGMTLDQAKLNVWQIRFQYLGGGAIELYVESEITGRFVLVHTIDYANVNTEPSVHNPNFFYTMWVANKTTTINIDSKCSSYAYFIEGRTSFVELHQPQFSSGLKEKTTVTTEVAILTIRNKTTYASKTNFIDMLIETLGASIEAAAANNLGSVRVVKNATLGGTPSYSDINGSNSVAEVDVAGTTVADGKELFVIPLAGKNDKEIRDVIDHKIILNPGDSLTIAGLSAISATIDADMLWRELF